MALIQCKECGREVSTKAKNCPGCGATMPRRTSRFTWIMAALFGFALVAFRSGVSESHKTESAKSPEQRAHDQLMAQLYSRGQQGANTLRKSMRNPDSFSLEETFASTGPGAICYTYRAQNGFGGMNREQAVLRKSGKFVSSKDSGFTNAWNADCAGQDGYTLRIS